VSFTVDGEGSAQDVSIGFLAGSPLPDLLVQAAATAIEECTWVLPGGGAPGPAARTVELRLPVIPFQKLQGPLTAPKMADPACFPNAFRFQGGWDREIRIAFKFPVYPDGKAGRARSVTPFANPGDRRRMEEAVTAAVKGCEWIPGRDGAGTPARIFVLLPLRMQ
jgi:hypothetical protein